MPHFDEFGGDEWICQAPNHRVGPRIKNSRVVSAWRTDITGHAGAGNCCPACVAAYDNANKPMREIMTISRADIGTISASDLFGDGLTKEQRFEEREVKRLAGDNNPRPSTCPFIRESTGKVCGGPLRTASGFAGEDVLVCDIEFHGIVWEDAEQAIRNVI